VSLARAFRVLVLWLAVASSSLAPTIARAQGNYRSVPTGGRSALLGDTGVALGSDGSSPFLNPATIVRIHDASLAFSVNFFAFGDTHVSGWHQPGAVDTARFGDVRLSDTSLSTTRFEVIPSTLCLFFTVAGWGDPQDAQIAPQSRHFIAPKSGRQKLAACLGTTEQQAVDLPAANFLSSVPGGATHTAQSLQQAWRRVHFGPSYGIDVTDALSLGVSLHGVFTSYELVRTSAAVTSDVSGQAATSSLGATGNGRSIDLDAIFGVTYRAAPLTFGASFKPPALHAFGSYDASLNQETATLGGQSAILATGSGIFRAPSPARIGLGVGAELGRLKIEVDGTYFFPLADAMSASMHVDTTTVTSGASQASSADLSFAARARPVIDGAIGAEYFVIPTFSILGGLATDVTSVPELSPDASIGTLHHERISRVALSLGIGSYGEGGTVLFGTQLSRGTGQALAVNPYVVPNQYAIVDAQTYGAMLIVAGSTDFRAIRGAVESVKGIVERKKPDDGR
jgi:hypothetical protein